MKIAARALGWLLVLAMLGLMAVVFALPLLFGTQLLVVRSGSMEPAIGVGDAIIVGKPAGEFKVGSIITYADGDRLITHRVVGVQGSGAQSLLRTKGDANKGEDSPPVRPDQVRGTFLFRLPYMGYVASMARQPVTWVVFVMIPAVLLVVGEIRQLLKPSTQSA